MATRKDQEQQDDLWVPHRALAALHNVNEATKGLNTTLSEATRVSVSSATSSRRGSHWAKSKAVLPPREKPALRQSKGSPWPKPSVS